MLHVTCKIIMLTCDIFMLHFKSKIIMLTWNIPGNLNLACLHDRIMLHAHIIYHACWGQKRGTYFKGTGGRNIKGTED